MSERKPFNETEIDTIRVTVATAVPGVPRAFLERMLATVDNLAARLKATEAESALRLDDSIAMARRAERAEADAAGGHAATGIACAPVPGVAE